VTVCQRAVDDGEKDSGIAGNGRCVDLQAGAVVEREDLEVGWVIPAFLVDLRVIVHKTIDRGHAIELRAQRVEE
jgi:hypothetical protein